LSSSVDNFALAEPLYSTSFTFFECLSKELGVVIIVPFEKEWRIYHNSAYIIDTDALKLVYIYKKMHIQILISMKKFYFHTGVI
jgi:N-carbamoylputrescine amidase